MEEDTLEAWILNLESDKKRLKQTKDSLEGSDPRLRIQRFEARQADRTSTGLSRLSAACPDKTLACSQTHRRVAAEIVKKNRVALVLEDDVIPVMPPSELLTSLRGAMQAAGSGWDMVLLNSMGPGCDVPLGERPGRLCGSTAAYLLSPKGASKLAEATLSWHADLLRNSEFFDVRQGPLLFNTRDEEPTGIVLGGRDIAWFGQQPVLRWGSGGAVRGWAVVLGVVLGTLGLAWAARLSACGNGLAAVGLGVGSGVPLAALSALVWHTSRDTNFARCSAETLALLMGASAIGALLSGACLTRGSFPALAAVCLFWSLVSLGVVACWTDEAFFVSRASS